MNEKKQGNMVLVSVLILLSLSIAVLQTQKKVSKDQPKYLYAHHVERKLQSLVVAQA